MCSSGDFVVGEYMYNLWDTISTQCSTTYLPTTTEVCSLKPGPCVRKLVVAYTPYHPQ